MNHAKIVTQSLLSHYVNIVILTVQGTIQLQKQNVSKVIQLVLLLQIIVYTQGTSTLHVNM